MNYVEGDVCPCWNGDNVTENFAGRLIYKDECCKCFGNPKDPKGLSVCLRTLAGYCGETCAQEYYD
jgi:uncharacterized UBP type Zn finger protein